MCLVCPVPNTYVGMQSCILAMMWWWCDGSATTYPMRCWAQHLRPDSMVWPYHRYHVWPCQACQKYSCTVRSIIGLWHGPYTPDRVDSTLALPWKRRSASEQQFHGVRLCTYTYITPIMQILYLVSIGPHHVPLHLMVWRPWLLPVSWFATRFCHYTSLVISVEGHHQTCLPLQKSLTAHCVVVAKSMPVFEGMLLHFRIFYSSGELAMTHLSCRTIPFLSVSPPQHIQAIDLLCFALTGSHWQMCPCHRHMLSISPISWMWMRYIFGSQGVIWWWILHWASKSSTEQSSRNVIYLLALALHMMPASKFCDRHSCANLLLGSFAQALMHKTPFLYQLIYPHYWVNLYAF